MKSLVFSLTDNSPDYIVEQLFQALNEYFDEHEDVTTVQLDIKAVEKGEMK